MILWNIIDEYIIYKISKFIELSSNWAKRKIREKTKETTEGPLALEVEVEAEKKETTTYNNKNTNIVKLSEKEYKILKKKYGERITQEYIERMSRYCFKKMKVYKDCYNKIENWLKNDGIEPYEEFRNFSSCDSRIMNEEFGIKNTEEIIGKETSEKKKKTENMKLFVNEYKKIDEILKEEINEYSYNAFIKPLRIKKDEEKKIELYTEDERTIKNIFTIS